MLKKVKRLTKRAPKRVTALTLCAAMLLSMAGMMLVTPAQAAGLVDAKDLYTREADKNTMEV